MKAPENKPKVTLVGKEYIDSYFDKATAGNYDHLLQVTLEYVEVS